VSAVRTDGVIDAFQAAWSSGDRGAFRAMCTPDVHYEDPLTEEPAEGPDALADHAVRLWQAFPDARVERAGERLTDGRYVAAPVKLVATHRGDIGELPATGRFIVVHAVLYCELDPPRELLWRVRAFFDVYDAANQLGVLPRPGSLGTRALLLLRGFGLRAR
jgi:steroid delta-isomerase-like uncharacterized protein